MRVVPLGDAADVLSGFAFKSEWFQDEGTKVIRIGDIDNEEVSLESCVSVDASKHKISESCVAQEFDILMALSGATTGKIGIVGKHLDGALVNQRVGIVRANNIDTQKYLRYIFAGEFLERLLNQAWGAAQANLSPRALRELKIPLPPIAEQRRIAAILDKADGIRRDRKQAIQYTEELLRSAFLDMFGDPVTNPRGWESGTILDIVSDKKKGVRCGPFGTQLKVHEIVSEGIPLYGIESVKGGRFRSKAEKYITIQKAEELKSFDVQSGDVLVTRMGTIGHACVVSNTVGESRFSYHLFRVRPDSLKCLPGFLSATITRSGTFLSQLERLSHGAIMSGLKTADLKEVRFLLPPMALQKHYLKIVSKTEEALERQIEKMSVEENLFNSLLQRAFQGDL